MPLDPQIDLESLRNKRFLLADDLEGSRVLGALFLKIAGAEVIVVSDGSQAVKKALAEKFDAVLMDIHMPEINGLDATEFLRKLGCQTPIIIVSSDTLGETQSRAALLGANSFIKKPFLLSGLVEPLKQVLSGATQAGPQLH